MSPTTDLMGWFLFRSGLPPQRAKALLVAWRHQGVTLRQALDRLPAGAQGLGVTSTEAAQLALPPALPALPPALAWDDPHYPVGLADLPANRQPALLFYRGDSELLARPVVAFLPADETPAAEDEAGASQASDVMREVISLLLGEPILLGVYDGSEQHALLLEEMAYSEGEALVFARAGLDAREETEVERAMLAAERLLVVSPLPPDAAYQPAWDPVLRQVATAAAHSVILAGPPPGGLQDLGGERERKPTLVLSLAPPSRPAPPNVEVSSLPADVLLWIDRFLDQAVDHAEEGEAGAAGGADLEAPGQGEAPPGDGGVDIDRVARRLGELDGLDLGPEPTTDEIIETLEKGGQIPEVLLRRLRGS
jgi:hypothetical protein